MCNFIKYMILTLTLLVVGESYAQNISTKLYIPADVTFYVGEHGSVHIESGFIQINTLIYDSNQTFVEDKGIKFISNKKYVKSKITAEVIFKEKVASSEKPKPATTVSLPFQNFPNDSLLKIYNKDFVPPPPTVTFKYENVKKPIESNNLLKIYLKNFLPQISLQDEIISTIKVVVLYNTDIGFFYLSRPPPTIIV